MFEDQKSFYTKETVLRKIECIPIFYLEETLHTIIKEIEGDCNAVYMDGLIEKNCLSEEDQKECAQAIEKVIKEHPVLNFISAGIEE